MSVTLTDIERLRAALRELSLVVEDIVAQGTERRGADSEQVSPNNTAQRSASSVCAPRVLPFLTPVRLPLSDRTLTSDTETGAPLSAASSESVSYDSLLVEDPSPRHGTPSPFVPSAVLRCKDITFRVKPDDLPTPLSPLAFTPSPSSTDAEDDTMPRRCLMFSTRTKK